MNRTRFYEVCSLTLNSLPASLLFKLPPPLVGPAVAAVPAPGDCNKAAVDGAEDTPLLLLDDPLLSDRADELLLEASSRWANGCWMGGVPSALGGVPEGHGGAPPLAVPILAMPFICCCCAAATAAAIALAMPGIRCRGVVVLPAPLAEAITGDTLVAGMVGPELLLLVHEIPMGQPPEAEMKKDIENQREKYMNEG